MSQLIAPRVGLSETFQAQIDLPYSPDTKACVRGFLLDLTKATTWEQISNLTVTPEQAATIGQAIYDSFKAREPMLYTALFQDVKGSGVDGGSAVVGWQQRTLNTTQYVHPNFSASLDVAQSSVSVPLGRLHIKCRAPAYQVGRHVLRVDLISFGSVWAEIIGESRLANAGEIVVDVAELEAFVVIDRPTSLKVYHRAAVAFADRGLGVATQVAGVSSIYTSLLLEYLSS